MKVKGWIHIMDCGDGSAAVDFFGTQEASQAAADAEFEEYGQSLCDNVESFEIDVDKKGNVIDPE